LKLRRGGHPQPTSNDMGSAGRRPASFARKPAPFGAALFARLSGAERRTALAWHQKEKGRPKAAPLWRKLQRAGGTHPPAVGPAAQPPPRPLWRRPPSRAPRG